MDDQTKFTSALMAMSKAIDRIADTIANFVKVFEHKFTKEGDKDKLSSAMTVMSEASKETAQVIKVFKQLYEQSEQRQKVIEKQKRIDGYLIPLITVLGVAVGLFVQSAWDYHRENIQYKYQQIQTIQERIKNKKLKKDKLNAAMVAVRSSREVASQRCRDNNYTGDVVVLRVEIMQAQYKLIDAWYGLKDVYGKPVQNEAKIFLDLSDKYISDNVCSIEGKKLMKTLKNLQSNLNDLMISSITKDKSLKTDTEREISD